MRLLDTYRAWRRNHMHPAMWRMKKFYVKAMEASTLPDIWAHTQKARKVVAGYFATMAGKPITVQDINIVLADHWLSFKPRTRCISRMLRDLLAPQDRHVLKSA